MKNKAEFIKAMNIQKDSEGHYYVGGSVMGDVKVNVWGACEHRR